MIVVVVLPFVINQIAEVLKIAIERINEFQTLLQTQGLPTVIEKHTSLPSSVKKYILDNVSSDAFITTLQSNLQQNISEIVTTGT